MTNQFKKVCVQSDSQCTEEKQFSDVYIYQSKISKEKMRLPLPALPTEILYVASPL